MWMADPMAMVAASTVALSLEMSLMSAEKLDRPWKPPGINSERMRWWWWWLRCCWCPSPPTTESREDWGVGIPGEKLVWLIGDRVSKSEGDGDDEYLPTLKPCLRSSMSSNRWCSWRMWLMRDVLCANFFSHMLHGNGFSFEWVLRWASKLPFCVNRLSQWGQVCGRSPVWIRLCVIRLHFWENRFSQISQE